MVARTERQPTPPDSIVLVGSESSQAQDLSHVLKRAVGQVARSSALAGITDYTPFALVAVLYDTLDRSEQEVLIREFNSRSGRPILLILSEHSAEDDFVRLFGAHVLTNMIVINESGVDISDLLVTIQKIRYGDVFGLEKYFVWGIEPRSLKVSSSVQKNEALETIAEYAQSIGVAPRLRTSIRTIADEFITNAVYNAPIGDDGRPRYSAKSRLEVVELAPDEQVDVRYCCDGRRFGISVTDPFGSLNPGRLQDYLARAYRRGSDQVSETGGGAGLGFYEMLDSASHLVVNIEPRIRTEMIGLIDVSGSYRRFVKSGKSFNIFVKEDRP